MQIRKHKNQLFIMIGIAVLVAVCVGDCLLQPKDYNPCTDPIYLNGVTPNNPFIVCQNGKALTLDTVASNIQSQVNMLNAEIAREKTEVHYA